MSASPIRWAEHGERAEGANGPTEDVVNRALKQILSQSGYDTAAAFPGLAGPVHNVKAYGAVGNGVANDTAAVQAALDGCHAAGGGVVYLPPGTYLVDPLTLPGNNVSLVGTGGGFGYNTNATVRTKLKARTTSQAYVLNCETTTGAAAISNCVLQDFEVDGDLKAVIGIKCAHANLLYRLRVRGCLQAGVSLTNFTNRTHIERCGLNDNFGWGLRVEGSSSTPFSVADCVISLNGLGGMDIEGGVLGHFSRIVLESNSGPAIKIYKPDAHTGFFGGFLFDSVWLEDNGVTDNVSIIIDAQTRDEAHSVKRVRFQNCRFTVPVVTRLHHSILCATHVTFEDCNYDNSDAALALTLGAQARYVSWINCETANGTGLSVTQLDAAAANGTRCFWTSHITKHVVGGAGSPAFENSWVNYGAGFPTAQFGFDRDGYVCLEGAIKTGSIGNVAFTLPAGYRPSTTVYVAVDSNGSHGLLSIESTGSVRPYVGSSTIFNLNGVRFRPV